MKIKIRKKKLDKAELPSIQNTIRVYLAEPILVSDKSKS